MKMTTKIYGPLLNPFNFTIDMDLYVKLIRKFI